MKLVIYRTRGLRGSGYRWRLVADNGRVLANGGQGYSRRIDMEAAIEKALGGALRGDWFDRPHRTAMDVHNPDQPPEVEAVLVEDWTAPNPARWADDRED